METRSMNRMQNNGELNAFIRSFQTSRRNCASYRRPCTVPILSILFFITLISVVVIILHHGDNSIIHPNQCKFNRSLIEPEPAMSDILENQDMYFPCSGSKSFSGTILGYLQTTDSKGFSVLKNFSGKFDSITPIWIQIMRRDKHSYEIIDNGTLMRWMKYTEENDMENIRVLPRFLYRNFTNWNYENLVRDPNELNIINSMMIEFCKKNKFDGVVLEIWPAPASRDVFQVISMESAKALLAENLSTVLVIPAVHHDKRDVVNQQSYDSLYELVEGFSLMTWDYSHFEKPGPTAPLFWMKEAVEHIVPQTAENYTEKRKKILMGFPMFGYEYISNGMGHPIDGADFLKYRKYCDKVFLDKGSVENFLETKLSGKTHKVFYPTLFSIDARIKLAEELKVGIAIWTIDQGLPYFYNLF